MSRIDDDDHSALGAQLRLLDAPPTRLDVAAAVGTARRADARRRRLVTGAVAVLVIGTASGAVAAGAAWHGPDTPEVATPPPPGNAMCVITWPGGPADFRANLADPTGKYFAGIRLAPGRNIPSMSLAGKVAEIPMPEPVTESLPVAVNPSGTVVGSAKTAGGGGFVWIYRDGATTRLPVPAGYDRATVTGLNDGGDVVGSAYRGEADRPTESVVVVWALRTLDRPRVLPVPRGATMARGGGITNDGTVAGTVFSPARVDSPWTPWAWHADGSGNPLTLPDGWSNGTVAGARDGWAYGSASLASPATSSSATSTSGAWTSLAIRWNLRTGAAQRVGGPSESATARMVIIIDASAQLTAVIGRNGPVHWLPMPEKGMLTKGMSTSDDGAVSFPANGMLPATWTCR